MTIDLEDDDTAVAGHGTAMAADPPENSRRIADTPVADNLNSSSENTVPLVEMCFKSEDEAYNFYNSYAKSNGFSIRRCHKKCRADGTLSSRYFVCSKSGVKATHPTHVTKKEQGNSRTACNARVQFSITRNGIWNVQKVTLDHNHQMVSPDKRHMLRSHRQLLDADRHIIKHIHKVFTRCNIIALPSNYILNRWTKYAKQEIFTSKPNINDSLDSMFAHTSRKMMSLALKCKPSKEVLRYLNDGIDKLALEVGDLLSKVNLEEVEEPESSCESTEELDKTMVPFKAPERVSARMEKRSKDALEGAKKGKKKDGGSIYKQCAGKVSNHPAKESVLVPLIVETLQADCVDNTQDGRVDTNPYTTVPFGEYQPAFIPPIHGEYQPAFVPPIHGEFTRLLFEVHGDGTTSAARQLDFGEGASTSRFQ